MSRALTTAALTRKRQKRLPAARLSQPDYPYTIKLPDGRTLFVEIPGEWVTTDRGGETAFLPPAVQLLDRVRVLATSVLDRPPSPGFLLVLRQALGLTRQQMGERVGVDQMTVSHWERGTREPSPKSLKVIEKVRQEAARRGVVIPFAKSRSRRT